MLTADINIELSRRNYRVANFKTGVYMKFKELKRGKMRNFRMKSQFTLLDQVSKPSRFPIGKKYHKTIDNIQRSNRFLGRMNLINGPLPLQDDCNKMYLRQ
ncbi:12796_t:CDS:1, partial [Funneliformis mosseae]